jgi:hypothetical protein
VSVNLFHSHAATGAACLDARERLHLVRGAIRNNFAPLSGLPGSRIVEKADGMLLRSGVLMYYGVFKNDSLAMMYEAVRGARGAYDMGRNRMLETSAD